MSPGSHAVRRYARKYPSAFASDLTVAWFVVGGRHFGLGERTFARAQSVVGGKRNSVVRERTLACPSARQ
jgi:hypothetical protein